jgi:hypothetical protein
MAGYLRPRVLFGFDKIAELQESLKPQQRAHADMHVTDNVPPGYGRTCIITSGKNVQMFCQVYDQILPTSNAAFQILQNKEHWRATRLQSNLYLHAYNIV